MAGQSSEEEENYWPGYVDALTTMTMVLTFVMMVLGVVVFTLAQNVSKTVVQAIAEATNVDTSKMSLSNAQEFQQAVVAALNARAAEKPPTPDSTPVAQRSDTTVQAMLQSAPPTPQSNDATPAPQSKNTAPASSSEKQDVESTHKEEDLPRKAGGTLEATGEGLRIFYADVAAVRPGDPEIAAVLGYLAKNPNADFAIRSDVVQTLAVNSGGATEGRRRAYYRAMLIREQMIKSGVGAERIVLQIRDAATDVKVDTLTLTAKNRAKT